jgi:phosphoglycolate phosphatase-like HAD superfamily hydrolase
MKLAVFDLDGTLLQTSGVDDECYAAALRDVFGIQEMSTDWGSYSDSTDAGILDDLLRQHRGSPMTADDAEAHRARFVELLEEVARRDRERFAQTPGAGELFESLAAAGWRCAIATGGWRASALLKLRVAGLGVSGVPAAFADDHRSREGIILTAVERTGGAGGVREAHAVYVGDGVWDVRAARNLGIGFVGIARGERGESLKAAGANGACAQSRVRKNADRRVRDRHAKP